VKPNVDELARWHGQTLNSVAAARTAAEALSRVTGGCVLLSRAANGAMLVDAGKRLCLTVAAPRVQVRNTVGTGDAMLAAVATEIAAGANAEIWLRHGVATGSAAASCLAGELPDRALSAGSQRRCRPSGALSIFNRSIAEVLELQRDRKVVGADGRDDRL
jgi:fructose-1-phosphate kinase PfkB-like protein